MANLNNSYLKYKIVVKNCDERIITFLNDLATAKANTGKFKAANIMIGIEESE